MPYTQIRASSRVRVSDPFDTAVLAALEASMNLDIFYGTPGVAGQQDVQVDPDGLAHSYAVLWPSPSTPDHMQDRACGVTDRAVVTFQVTAAGGDMDRARSASRKVLAALDGARLLPGAGLCRAEAGSRLTADMDPPHRAYVALVFTADVGRP